MKYGASALAGTGMVLTTSGKLISAAESGTKDTRWAFLIDTHKCVGCGFCVKACKLENEVPMEANAHRTWVERYVIKNDGQVVADTPEAGINGYTKNDPQGMEIPAEEIATMLEQQSNLSPPLFMNVPQNYQIAHQLLVDESGSIWIYLKSTERTGFLRLSPEGRETGFFTASAEFDMLSARMMIANSRMYFLAAGREETTIHYFDLP